ncbi:hypothetical protein Kpho02_15820 [Kitasatospora phosalacinea]|uniref:Uncharacterized protein n=1 Tax=Kitasatospora phosalacinea TaxID=2065 RepID=A0A9W6Q686_9ACTN|nr:hypothetical protein Kpho02_15820 [Kitasatospora phosalacinea]
MRNSPPAPEERTPGSGARHWSRGPLRRESEGAAVPDGPAAPRAGAGRPAGRTPRGGTAMDIRALGPLFPGRPSVGPIRRLIARQPPREAG